MTKLLAVIYKRSLVTYYCSLLDIQTAMKEKKKIKLSRLEMEVMEPLWKMGNASIRQIHESLPEEKRPEFTTVQTIIYRLEEKGAVTRLHKIGNAYIFKTQITRKSAIGNLVDDLLSLLGGSPNPMMAHLLETGKITLKELKQMETFVNNTQK